MQVKTPKVVDRKYVPIWKTLVYTVQYNQGLNSISDKNEKKVFQMHMDFFEMPSIMYFPSNTNSKEVS